MHRSRHQPAWPIISRALYRHHFDAPAEASTIGESVRELIAAYEAKLLQPLLDCVSEKNTARLIGPARAAGRAPTVAIQLREPGAVVAKRLAPLGIMAGGGNFYGVRCLQGLGIDPDHGVLRVSFVHYTTQAEIDKLIAALDQVL